MTTTFTSTLPKVATARAARVRRFAYRGLAVALAGSLAVHLGFSLWPVEMPTAPDNVPLVATITEMPPPPKPVATPAPRPPKPRLKAPSSVTAPAPVALPAPEPEPTTIEPTPEAIAAGPALPTPTDVAPVLPPPAVPDVPVKTLPPRVDLVYKAFLGTRGFLIGEATYRFEHAVNEYRITTVGEARGLAALFLRGQGRLESRGTITAAGLRPLEFSVERGSRERRESALFDWETGIVTLHEQKTSPLELPTFDPLALMWQYYFTPPTADEVMVSVATTRRVARYSLTREGTDRIAWGQGEIDAERWHRRSEDGKTDAYFWLASSLRFIPVKIRVTNTDRGTVEALLDSIRVDEEVVPQ
ncbi:MAG: DUF3108 domain-containing protein [Betaproteobacteria bacterium]